MIDYRYTSAVAASIIGVLIIYLIRKDHMRPRYASWWVSIACAVVLFGFFPGIIDRIGYKLGIHYPPILLIIIGIGFVLVKMLRMDLEHSSLERRLRRVVQRMAILEERLGEHESALAGTKTSHAGKQDRTNGDNSAN